MAIIDQLTLAFIAREEPNRVVFLEQVPDGLRVDGILLWAQHARCTTADDLRTYIVHDTLPQGETIANRYNKDFNGFTCPGDVCDGLDSQMPYDAVAQHCEGVLLHG